MGVGGQVRPSGWRTFLMAAVHEGGFRITGDANATLTFHRPDGTVLGTSHAGRDEIAS